MSDSKLQIVLESCREERELLRQQKDALLAASKKALEILRHSVAASCSDAQEFGGSMADRLAFDALDEAIAAVESGKVP